MASFYRIQMENWLKEIEVKAESILDIGSGDRLAKDRIKKCKCKNYITLDIDKKFHPHYIWDMNEMIDGKDIFTFQEDPYFDVIFCLEVFEYLKNPFNAMRNLANWLRKGGKLYITFPLMYPIHNPREKDSLRYTDNWIKWAFRKFQFREVNIIPRIRTSHKLEEWFMEERMHKIEDGSALHIGYLVEAIR